MVDCVLFFVMTLASLEVIKDEKASLSSSLEMHVEMTIQLQQEIDDLKAEQVRTGNC